MDKKKSLLDEIYKMDIDTLRKYCIDLLKRNAEYYRKNLSKTSPNNDYEARKDSPKVCPQCYPEYTKNMNRKEGEYWVCPDCKRCIEGKPSHNR